MERSSDGTGPSAPCSPLLDHFRAPRNLGSFARDAPGVGTGETGRAEEGALVRIQVRVGPDGIVSDVCFKAFGCPATIACGSWATEWVRGRSLEEARSLTPERIARALALPEDRWGCARITQGALVAALDGARRRGAAPE